MNFFKLLITSLTFVVLFNANSFAGDAAKGKKIYTKCKACHNADAEKNKIGPHLVGIVGRKSGSVASYTKYSKDLKDAGIDWTEANLNKWLENPKGMYKGTKMLYPGLKKEQDRLDVIEYLKTK